MSIISGSKYDGLLAQFYDADHQWRDYKKQAALVSTLFEKCQKNKIRILDIGCGTGSHALELAKNGFQVVGIDRSSALLQIAKEKTIQFRKQIRFLKKDFRKMCPNSILSDFDCALFLGWSLNIAPIYEQFSRLLHHTAPLLKRGGFFILDAAIGRISQAIPSHSLHYQISQSLQGTLKIQEKVDRKKSFRHLTYNWEIIKNARPKPQRIVLQAKENLVILEPEMLYKKIQAHSKNFEVVKTLGDYHLASPYRKGNKNCIILLRKKI